MFSGVPSILPMGHLHKHTTATAVVEVLTTLTQRSSSHSVRIVDSHLFELAFRCSSHHHHNHQPFLPVVVQPIHFNSTNKRTPSKTYSRHSTHTHIYSALTSHSHKIFQIYTFLECEYIAIVVGGNAFPFMYKVIRIRW